MRTTTALAVFCAAVLIGCEPVTEPEVNVPDPSFAVGPAVEAAFGTVYTPGPPGYSGFTRMFSVSATAKDGTAKGKFQYRILNTEWWGKGEVICMTIKGGTAYIGGVYTRATPGTGGYRVFAVKDNGRESNVPPDQITYLYPRKDEEGLRVFCDNPPDIPVETWVDVEKGDIIVRGQ